MKKPGVAVCVSELWGGGAEVGGFWGCEGFTSQPVKLKEQTPGIVKDLV